MADQHEGGAQAAQLALQPLDGRQVEVVGRLVEQENIRGRCQHARQRRTPRLAARQVIGVLLAAHAELLQQIAGLMRVVGRAEAILHIGQRAAYPERSGSCGR